MFTFINTGVIFAFGLVIAGIVGLGVLQAREFAERETTVAANRDNLARRRAAFAPGWSACRTAGAPIATASPRHRSRAPGREHQRRDESQHLETLSSTAAFNGLVVTLQRVDPDAGAVDRDVGVFPVGAHCVWIARSRVRPHNHLADVGCNSGRPQTVPHGFLA